MATSPTQGCRSFARCLFADSRKVRHLADERRCHMAKDRPRQRKKAAAPAQPASEPLAPLPPDVYLTAEALAERLGTTKKALEALRRRGKGPKWVPYLTRGKRYKWGDAVAWLENGGDK
jgi:hypothetical protein